MISIILEVCGDHWLNSHQVQQSLANLPPGPIELDVRSEGPSLAALGVVGMFEKFGIDPSRVTVTRFSNPVETLPWRRKDTHDISHFFWLSKRYWVDPGQDINEFLFGFFMGRRTVPRCCQIYDLWHEMKDRVLFSIMHTRVPDLPAQFDGVNLDAWQQWGHAETISQWLKSTKISSLDDKAVHQQYDPAFNTNRSLLDHYHRFSIEIVSETYTRGNCFFPTEKTVRPLMAKKPMLIYGPRHYVKRLKNLGFRTWSEVWDESYDDLEGPQRWQKIKQVMGKISQLHAEECKEIGAHNRSRLEEIIKEYQPK